jgi:hypothetical protein
MAKKVQWIIDYCNAVVNDDGTKWGSSWLPFVNSGQLLIADIFPAATARTQAVQLAVGVEQSAPVGSLRFLGLGCNMGDDGATPGDVITLCEEEFLSGFNPSWMAATPSATIENYMFDENEPTSFRVYPPAAASVWANVRYSAVPSDCVSESDLLTVGDKYAAPLAEWCLYLALSAETDAADPNKAASHLSTFFNLLGIKKENRVMYSPNVRERAGHPPVEATK